MKVVVAGGIGQLGGEVVRRFVGEGHEVVVLARSVRKCAGRVVVWDGTTLGDWARELDGADVVLNLAGRSVDCRYTEKNQRQIMDSRVLSTRAIGRAIAQSKQPAKVWLQSSTATIYAHTYGPANDEDGAIGGNEPDAPVSWGFSIEVAKAWEAEAMAADTPETRRVLMRTAMVMAPTKGGVFDKMLTVTRLGLGGAIGDGRQYMSWIHIDDFYRSLWWMIEHPEMAGPVNVAAPTPVGQAAFFREIRKAWGVPVGLPAMKWMIEVGMFVLRSESELIFKSRRVTPGKLLAGGFGFLFPDWPEAARDLCRRRR